MGTLVRRYKYWCDHHNWRIARDSMRAIQDFHKDVVSGCPSLPFFPFVNHVCPNKCFPVQIHSDWKERKKEGAIPGMRLWLNLLWLPNPFVFCTVCPFNSSLLLPQQAACLVGWWAAWHQLRGRKHSAISAAQAEFVLWCYFQFRGHFPVIKLTAFLKSHADQKTVLFLRSQRMLMLVMVNCNLSCCRLAVFLLFTDAHSL